MATWTRKDGATRRSEILEAAERLVNRYGMDRFSLREVAHEAGLSKSSIYVHFDNKEDLFRALMSYVLDAPMQRAEKISKSPGSTADRVTEMLLTKVGYFYQVAAKSSGGHSVIDSAETVASDILEEDRKTYSRLIARVLSEAVALGEFDLDRADFTARTLAVTLIGAAHGLAREGRDFTSPRSYRKHLSGLVKATLAGLAPS
jgi:AcrR family transcriptional regulator